VIEVYSGILAQGIRRTTMTTTTTTTTTMMMMMMMIRTITGYEEHTTKRKVSHLLYLDDLKLIGKTEEEFQEQMQVVRTFSDDIRMDFGLDKWAQIVLKTRKLVLSKNLISDSNR